MTAAFSLVAGVSTIGCSSDGSSPGPKRVLENNDEIKLDLENHMVV